MKVIIVVVTYNGSLWIRNCLKSVLSSKCKNAVIEALIIDNASTDDSTTIIKTEFPNVRLVELENNIGFGKANNVGFAIAKEVNADYVFLLNQDAYLAENAIEQMILMAEGNPDYGVLSPIQMNGDGTALDYNFASLVSESFTPGFTNDLYMKRLNRLYNTKFVMAAMWLITRKCYLKVGFFEPLFPHNGEDNDYINRVTYHGFKIGICTQATGFHDRENRLLEKRSVSAKDYFISFLVTVLNINLSPLRALRAGYIGLIKSALSLTFRGDFLGLKYYWKALKLFPAIIAARKNNKHGIMQYKRNVEDVHKLPVSNQ